MHGRLRLALAAGLLVLGTLSLNGCGVRGSLEAPPQEKTETGNAVPGTPGEQVPQKGFVLDRLIR
jgi:predicted small lipoprotein YifL